MDFQLLLAFTVMICSSMGNQFKLYNNCPFTVWPGIQGNPGKANLENGGFQLGSYGARVINTPPDWAGRIWARTECDGSGHCVTGDCGNKIECNGAGGVPPVSLAEITLKGANGLDYYDVSLVDGYNLPLTIQPTGGYTSSGGKYDCKPAGCNSDLNAKCPNELAVKPNGYTVACKSACLAFNTDQYCCRGDYGTPDTCKSENWPTNYPAIFKSACPDAYSYAYDDTTSTFTCRGQPDTSYDIVFCP